MLTELERVPADYRHRFGGTNKKKEESYGDFA